MIRYSRFNQWVWSKLVALLEHQGGLSALEFSLFAPIVILGMVTMADIGIAVSQRMSLDHALRAGAQRAMADPGADTVLAAIEATGSEALKPVAFNAERYCHCPDNPLVKVVCSTICPLMRPTNAFYMVSAVKTYPGMLIPPITFRPEIQVQVR